MPKRETITYHKRGQIEIAVKPGSYAWVDGWSETTEDGVSYPWMPYRACLEDARRRECWAEFKEKEEVPA